MQKYNNLLYFVVNEMLTIKNIFKLHLKKIPLLPTLALTHTRAVEPLRWVAAGRCRQRVLEAYFILLQKKLAPYRFNRYFCKKSK
jgi:hypothetical protein